MRLRIMLIVALLSPVLSGTSTAQAPRDVPPPGSPAAWSSYPPASAFVPGAPTISPPASSPIGGGGGGVPALPAPYCPPSYCPPPIIIGGAVGWPYYPYYPIVPTVRGPFLEELYPPPPPPEVPLALRIPPPTPRPKRADPSRAAGLITLGDRHFRARDLRRANERYEEAARLHPGSAAVRVRIAQIALARGQYTEAAHLLREALAAEPGWLTRASDIQNLYGEPADFKAPIDRLERHLQSHPNDRDAWLVLGAQWFLSGRTRQAADVFLRLTDRKADPTLAAFLDASQAQPE